ncbi:MAG: hypothetical protein JKY04_03305 [Sneathiella sp.]|nr:hypothetical protein [Sneathiella sp.]MBL4898725.1 hypothetical protein [Colwellia sp.]
MKAFGISALVLSIVAIFIPMAGVFIAGLAGFLAIFSAGKGTPLGLSAVILNIVNIMFLSPSLIIAASSQAHRSGETEYAGIFGFLLMIQVAALIAFVGKWMLSKRSANNAI